MTTKSRGKWLYLYVVASVFTMLIVFFLIAVNGIKVDNAIIITIMGALFLNTIVSFFASIILPRIYWKCPSCQEKLPTDERFGLPDFTIQYCPYCSASIE